MRHLDGPNESRMRLLLGDFGAIDFFLIYYWVRAFFCDIFSSGVYHFAPLDTLRRAGSGHGISGPSAPRTACKNAALSNLRECIWRSYLACSGENVPLLAGACHDQIGALGGTLHQP